MVRCDDRAQGILIDFDLAVDFETQHHPIRGAGFVGDRSGSTPFLALELLKDEPTPLRYRHDLESFFWVLWWIAVYCEFISLVPVYRKGYLHVSIDDQGARNDRRPFEQWHHGTWENMLDKKAGFLQRPPMQTVPLISPQFKGLTKWLIKLTAMFQAGQDSLTGHSLQAFISTSDLPPYDHDTMEGHVTYEAFMAILEEEEST